MLVISDELAAYPRSRLDRLFGLRHLAPEIEPLGWCEDDWRGREAEGDPFVEILKRAGLEVSAGQVRQ